MPRCWRKLCLNNLATSYLENNCLPHPHQGVYRCGKSTEDILLIAVDSIIHSLDRSEAVCAAFHVYKHVLNSKVMKLLIDPLIFPHLNYSLSVWGPPLYQNLSQQLKRMQNQTVRLCRDLQKYNHVTEHYCNLHCLPMEYLIQYIHIIKNDVLLYIHHYSLDDTNICDKGITKICVYCAM